MVIKHLQQPNRATCFITCLAMLWNVDLDTLLGLIGHDGTEKLWPDLPEPFCYRGHSLDEAMWLAYMTGNRLLVVNRESKIGHNELDACTVKTPYLWSVFVRDQNFPKILLNDHHSIVYEPHDCVIYDPSRLFPSRFNIIHDDYDTCLW